MGQMDESREIGSARSEEVAVICHELRNSLAVVRGAARLLRSPGIRGGVDTAHSLIERHVSQMSQHVQDLIEPPRRNGLNGSLQLLHHDLRVIAGYAADAIGPDMARRRHRLRVEMPTEPVWVHADGVRLEQSFCNVLINAAKYTPNGGDISLTLEREDGLVRVRIRDSGVGIDPSMLVQVFKLFVQSEGARLRGEGGRGIGLAVVQRVIEMHGGTVQAISAGHGHGSEFTIVLPVLREPLLSVIAAP